MTHDPLCPRVSHPKICEGDGSECPVCQCDLIAQVRADQSMIDYAKHLELDYERTRESWEAGYKEGREAAKSGPMPSDIPVSLWLAALEGHTKAG